ncbi:hypothetical protein BDB00DRAFT_862584 [Zychaea mexicana]|uniref:uncharacterized protein n=1 Tax=Zychaea mexicana TaxID=64656 RepID=UPI0022FEECC1|nr:uncharacterized protein BDB00DRAFT_862584 [Zychaea mexicana]KAI9470468.1 hypothetical protein BDB00DRAFT_862584 [Zychaea mexicana]
MNSLIRPLQKRAFSTSTPASKQFLVLIRDFKDSEALNRRLLIRDLHLKGANKEAAAGQLLCGGAVLDTHESGKMVGSCMIWEAESEEEVRKKLQADPYFEGKVWEDWDIFPFKVAVGALGKK